MRAFFRRWFPVLLLMLCSFLLACFVEKDVFGNPYAINDDVRNQAYWMNQILDPSLYPNDLAARYFTNPSCISPILWVLYWFASHWIDPIQFSQFLPFLLAPLATFFLYQLGKEYGGKEYSAWLCFFFNLYIWLLANLAGALPRAFMYPLLFLFLWMRAKKKPIASLLVSLISGLIYPPCLLICLGIIIFDLISTKNQAGPKPILWSLSTLGLSLLTLFLRFHFGIENHFGPLANFEIAQKMPEFYTHGRVPILLFEPDSIQFGVKALSSFLIRLPSLRWLLMITGVVLGRWLYKKVLIPKWKFSPLQKDVWVLLIVSCVLYTVAMLFMFQFYVPERYLQYTIPFILLLIVSNIPVWLSKQTSKPVLLNSVLVISLLTGFSFLWRDDLINCTTDQRDILLAISHLPKTANIAAAFSSIANEIPVFAKRNVLVNSEVTIPFHLNYYKLMRARLEGLTKAYYSNSPQEIADFIQKYHVDYWVINTEDYSPNRLQRLPAKYFNAFPRPWFRQFQERHSFALLSIASRCALVTKGTFQLISSKALQDEKCLVK